MSKSPTTITLKTIHFLFLIVNSEEIISLVMLDGINFDLLYYLSHNQRLRIEHWEIPCLILLLISQDNEAKIEALRFSNFIS